MNNQADSDMGVNMNPDLEGEGVVSGDCPNCGMPKEDWRGNGGEGFQLGSSVYCCQGCATGAGCTCQ